MDTLRKFILDTDLGPDCDDCGALAILDAYHRDRKIQLLGVTHCTSDLYSVTSLPPSTPTSVSAPPLDRPHGRIFSPDSPHTPNPSQGCIWKPTRHRPMSLLCPCCGDCWRKTGT